MLLPPAFKVQLNSHPFHELRPDSLSGIPDHRGTLRVPIKFCLAVKSVSRSPGEQGLYLLSQALGPESQEEHSPLVSNRSVFLLAFAIFITMGKLLTSLSLFSLL